MTMDIGWNYDRDNAEEVIFTRIDEVEDTFVLDFDVKEVP